MSKSLYSTSSRMNKSLYSSKVSISLYSSKVSKSLYSSKVSKSLYSSKESKSLYSSKVSKSLYSSKVSKSSYRQIVHFVPTGVLSINNSHMPLHGQTQGYIPIDQCYKLLIWCLTGHLRWQQPANIAHS